MITLSCIYVFYLPHRLHATCSKCGRSLTRLHPSKVTFSSLAILSTGFRRFPGFAVSQCSTLVFGTLDQLMLFVTGSVCGGRVSESMRSLEALDPAPAHGQGLALSHRAKTVSTNCLCLDLRLSLSISPN